MSSAPRLHILLLSLALLPACSTKMQTRLDAVWEHFDPMGHRKGHQVHYYPRANNPGMRLPEDEERDKLLEKARKQSKYAVPMAGYGSGTSTALAPAPSAAVGTSSQEMSPYALPLPGLSGAGKRAVSPDGYALPGSSMPVPRE